MMENYESQRDQNLTTTTTKKSSATNISQQPERCGYILLDIVRVFK